MHLWIWKRVQIYSRLKEKNMTKKSEKQKVAKAAAEISAVSKPKKISKRTIAFVKKYFEAGYNIEEIVQVLVYRENFRELVIVAIRKIKGEQYLVDNAERLGYPEHQMNDGEISSKLDELIKQWFALKSDNSQERLDDIIMDSIVRNSPE